MTDISSLSGLTMVAGRSRQSDNQTKFAILCKRLEGIIGTATKAEVDIARSFDADAVFNVLVVDSAKTEDVARFVRKMCPTLKIIARVDYSATEPGETPATCLVYGEVAR